MKSSFFVILCSVFVFASAAIGQTASNEPWPFPGGNRRGEDDSKFVKDMLAKQQSDREKKEYATLLERGEAALTLSNELEESFQTNDRLTQADAKRLEEFEKLVVKIREDLGGNDDGEKELSEEEDKPRDVRQGFIALKGMTEKLVAELKKSTRYSVSIVAIESSNTLIKIARVLRFWK